MRSGAVPEILVSGLDYIEKIGSNYVFVMYRDRTAGGVIVRKNPFGFIMPAEAADDLIMKACRARAISVIGMKVPSFN